MSIQDVKYNYDLSKNIIGLIVNLPILMNEFGNAGDEEIMKYICSHPHPLEKSVILYKESPTAIKATLSLIGCRRLLELLADLTEDSMRCADHISLLNLQDFPEGSEENQKNLNQLECLSKHDFNLKITIRIILDRFNTEWRWSQRVLVRG